MINTAALLAHVDLRELMAADLGPGRKSGRWMMWRCPFHADDNPSLGVDENGRWHCFGCSASGNAIGWLMERHHLSFLEACQQLDTSIHYSSRPIHAAPKHNQDGPPPGDWQERILDVLDICERFLWSDGGRRALTHLRRRGFRDDYVKRWPPFGYNPKDQEIAGLWIPRGILLPCEEDTVVWYCKVRRPRGSGPKYLHVKGGRPALYGADSIGPHAGGAVVFTEGEFDARLLSQEAGDLAAIVTLGSARKRLETIPPAHLTKLLRVSPYYIAYDLDEAGESGAAAIAQFTARARRVVVRKLRPTDKDLTDFYLSGGNLRAWLQSVLEGK